MQASCAADLVGSLHHFMYRVQPLYKLYACVDLSRASICYLAHAALPLQSQPLNHCKGNLWFVLARAPLKASGTPTDRAGGKPSGLPERSMYLEHILLETAMCSIHPCCLLRAWPSRPGQAPYFLVAMCDRSWPFQLRCTAGTANAASQSWALSRTT